MSFYMSYLSNKPETGASWFHSYFEGDFALAPAKPSHPNYPSNKCCLAITQGDIGTVQSMVGDIDINKTSCFCVSPLLYAAYAVKKGAPNAEEILELIIAQNPKVKTDPDTDIIGLTPDLKRENVSSSPLGNILLIEDKDQREKWFKRFLKLGFDFSHELPFFWSGNYKTHKGKTPDTRKLLPYLFYHHKDLLKNTLYYYGEDAAKFFGDKESFDFLVTYRKDDAFNLFLHHNKTVFLQLCAQFGCPQHLEELAAEWKGAAEKEAMSKLYFESQMHRILSDSSSQTDELSTDSETMITCMATSESQSSSSTEAGAEVLSSTSGSLESLSATSESGEEAAGNCPIS